MATPLHLLMVELSGLESDRLLNQLEAAGYAPRSRRVRTADELQAALADPLWEVVLAGEASPAFHCREALALLQAADRDLPFIVVSPALDGALLEELLAAGAQDCITDPERRLLPALRRELRAAALRREARRLAAVFQESEENFRWLVENVPEAMFVHAEGRLIYVNPAALRLFGAAEASALVGTPLLNRIHPDFHALSRERIRKSQETGKPSPPMEQRYLRLDGSVVEVEVTAVLVPGFGVIVLARDIGERKRLEAERQRGQRLTERLAGEMAVIAEIGRIIGSSLDIEAVYERFAAEVRKLIPWDRISVNLHEPGADRYTIAYLAGLEIPGRSQGETYLLAGTITDLVCRRRTGLVVDYSAPLPEGVPHRPAALKVALQSVIAVPLITRDAVIGSLLIRSKEANAYGEEDLHLAERIAAQIAGALANARLFAELQRTEQSLRDSEERLRALFEQTAVGIAEVDVPTGRFLTVNPRLCELLGRTEAELVGLPFLEVTHPEDRGVHVAQHELLKARRIPNFTLEKRYLRRDGTPFWVNLTVAALWGREPEAQRFIIAVQDISDRKRAEAERQELAERVLRAEKMEAIGTLAGGVAHDLNNILGVLVGYGELLQESLPAESPLRRFTAHILQAGLRSAAIVQDLLTLSRRGVTVSEPLDLNAVVQACLRTPEMEKLRRAHPQVTFRTDLAPDLPRIQGSAAHLSKTVMNLLINALEAIAAAGEIEVATDHRDLEAPLKGYDEVRRGHYVILTVRDSGRGIAERDLPKIFEPFYTRKTMGRAVSGLGLPVVWGTVKDHGGYIDVESAEGKGTLFSLYFPVLPAAATAPAPPAPEEKTAPAACRGRGETILVVDDVPEQREVAASLLTKLGYQVATVPGGEEAVAYLRRQPVDLLLLDMVMEPGIDGLETYRRAREIHPGQKAVIVSGYAETDRVREALSLGAGPYVRKPYILERIGAAVREALDRTP